MSSLRKFLLGQSFKSIKLKQIPTGHLQCEVKINGITGWFILDTGASSSCIDLAMADYFLLLPEESSIRAAGAGASNMLTKSSVDNQVEVGEKCFKKFKLVIFDLSHVNVALEDHDSGKVHGILGADILEKGKAVIDYKSKRLYLK